MFAVYFFHSVDKREKKTRWGCMCPIVHAFPEGCWYTRWWLREKWKRCPISQTKSLFLFHDIRAFFELVVAKKKKKKLLLCSAMNLSLMYWILLTHIFFNNSLKSWGYVYVYINQYKLIGVQWSTFINSAKDSNQNSLGIRRKKHC